VHTLSNSLRSSSTCPVYKLKSDFHILDMQFSTRARHWIAQEMPKWLTN
jgi:hypothetical protein